MLSFAFCNTTDLKAMKKEFVSIDASDRSKKIEFWICKDKYLSYLGSNLNLDDMIMIGEKRILCRARETLTIGGIMMSPSIIIDASTINIKGIIICSEKCVIKSKKKIDLKVLKLMGEGKFFINDEEYRATDCLEKSQKFSEDILKKLYVEHYPALQKKKD